ncbi:MAG TPA: efflux RND transporter permease subunit [Firmicutes bacterium]|nr:efflux RND transporter permease subunit [Bacillota bacterium]
MRLSQFVVRRPVTVSMMVAVILLLGCLAVTRLEIDMLPNLQLPVVGIVTVYPGADPQAVEGQITNRIESAIATVSGLKSLQSYSMENASVVIATFNAGVNPSDAVNDLTTLIAPVSATLPANTIQPVIVKVDPRLFSLATLGVTGSDDIVELTDISENVLKPILEELPGVARVNLIASSKPEISILFDTQVLRDNNIPPYTLLELIASQNVMVPAGPLVDDGTRYNVRVGNPFRDVEDIRNLVIGEKKTTGLEAGGFAALIPQVLLLRDVAQVVEGTSPQQAYARVNGQPAVLLQVYKHANASSIAVSAEIKRALDRLNAEAGEAVEVRLLGDQSEFITTSLADVGSAAIQGAVLAIICLFLFSRSWRSLAVLVVSIPISIVICFILMYFGKLSLNLVSLGGLALGVGNLVDDGIAVLDNILRHHHEGKGARDAAERGSREIAMAMVASALTSIVVFVPFAFLYSTAGQWFRDMALTVSFTSAASLVVAITVVPALSAKLLGNLRRRRVEQKEQLADALPQPVVDDPLLKEPDWIARMRRNYGKRLERVLGHPVYVMLIAVLLLGIGGLIPGRLPVELLPNMSSNAINVTLTMPIGTPTTTTNQVAMQIEKSISTLNGVASVWSRIGQDSDDVVQLIQGSGNHVAGIHVNLVPADQRQHDTYAIADQIRTLLANADLAGGHLAVSTERVTDSLGADYSPGATIHIKGRDLHILEQISMQVAERLQAQGGFTEISTSVEERQPELIFTVDRTKALLGSMTTGVVGLMLRAAISGQEVTTLEQNGRSIPVVMRAHPRELDSLDALLDMYIQGVPLSGVSNVPAVRFSRVVSTEKTQGPVTIEHTNRMRTVTVSAKLADIDLSEAKRRMQAALAAVEFPFGVEAEIAGVHRTIDEAVNEMVLVLAIGILLVYIVMAAQFESFLYPFIMMLTVPAGIAGGLAALWLTGQNMGVSALMGLIIVVSVVTRNGIVLVDAINQERAHGKDLDEAILTAARNRIRPILMTSITTVAGLLPLAIAAGEGTELQKPLSIAAMGGLIISTILTLYVVPAAYKLIAKRRPVVIVQEQQQLMG